MDQDPQWITDLSNIPADDGPETYNESFIELSQLGYLSKTVDWCGHTFTIKTLNIEEEIAASKLVREYDDSLAQYKVTLTGIVAASIVAIDGVPFLPFIGEGSFEQHMALKYGRVSTWFWPVVEFLSQAHAKLAEEAKGQLEELEKKFSGSTKVS